MPTGYVRADVSNEIDAGKVAKASSLDLEFDAIEDAFGAAAGHSHDGTAGEGGAILVVGPVQDVLVDATSIYPKTDDAYDLGKSGAEWKDLYVDGIAYLDTVDIDAGAIDGTPIGSVTPAAGAFTTLSATGVTTLNLATLVTASPLPTTKGGTGSTTLAGARTNLGLVPGTDVQVFSSHLAAIDSLAKTDGNFIVANGSTFVAESGSTARTSLGLGSMATQNSSGVTISGGSISGITDLAIADGGTGASTAATARTNLGLAIGSDVQAYSSALATIATNSGVDTASLIDNAVTLAKIADAALSGADATLITGTAGADGTLAGWNADGDLVASGFSVLDQDDMSSDSATAIPTQQSVKAYVDSQGWTFLAAQSTLSGTSKDFTVPDTAQEIVVGFAGTGLTGTGDVLVQLGDSGGVETSGYVSGSFSDNTNTSSTSGFIIRRVFSGTTLAGSMHLQSMDDANTVWVAQHGMMNSTIGVAGGGYTFLTAGATTVRVTRTGTDSFNAGTLYVKYR